MKFSKTMTLFVQIIFLLCASALLAQTTGKIAGKVTDQDTREPLPGVNILIEGTTRGAATDVNGDFYIINVSPGVVKLRAQMLGYETVLVENLRVSVNRTTNVEIKLKPTVLSVTKEVVITADKIEVKKDQTGSIRNVSADQIDLLPVESVGAVVALQPGVVVGHIRGGRMNEVSYMIDGLQVDEAFGGDGGKTVDLEPESIQDLEVITGTFNAEYGRAMSGIVNAVTKDGGEQFHGFASVDYANYLTSNKDVFIGLKDSEFDRNQDYKIQLSGPFLTRGLSFFANYRFQDYKNHLNGLRRFNVDDASDFQSDNPNEWFSQHTGDNAFASMNGSKNHSFTGKLTASVFKNIKTSLLYNLNDDEWHNYDHAYKYNPDGLRTVFRRTDMYSLQLNHLLSGTAFYELKLSYVDNYNGHYVFENPLDSRYVNDRFLYGEEENPGPGFNTGGQEKDHSRRTMRDFNAKLDASWQLNKNHSFKAGVLFTDHDLDNRFSQIRNLYDGTDLQSVLYQPVVLPDSTIYSDIYRVKPKEISGYLQDKIEYQEIVVNVGLRYDYFDPNTVYPSERRNPANQLGTAVAQSTYPKADVKTQLSPRLGLAYQLSDVALLRFSYGHFFQMPPLYALYENHSFQVEPTDYETTMGNAQIKAEKTVQYELGLWQQIGEGMGLEVALFYRDIYDLLSAVIVSTFNQIEYGLYSNKDYGNAKGLELKYEYASGSFFSNVNYTLQFTRGNADNPRFTFDRRGDSRDPIATLVPMSWDQRHTLNASVGYNKAKYGVTMTAYYNSGTPYTWSPLAEDRVAGINLLVNNDKQPTQTNVDLSGYYNLRLMGGINARLTLSVYNLFDQLNEASVNGRTGRAYTDIIYEQDLLSHHSDFNDYFDRIHNPSQYATPRYVKLGMGVSF